MNNLLRPFHLAFPVRNLKEAREWYTEVLGCKVGRESDEWVDLNLYGHQIVAHLSESRSEESSNEVDGHSVPIRHFGVILDTSDWEKLRDKLMGRVEFLIPPNKRFKGSPGEQMTMFIKDPSGNCLEFKSFIDDKMIFEK